MPFFDKSSEILVRRESVRLRSNQIILWLSLSRRAIPVGDPIRQPFPAILDTGHTHSFSIHDRHLHEWCGIRRESLPSLGAINDRGTHVTLHPVLIWAHVNKRGQRDLITQQEPFPIKATGGIAVYPGNDFPRLPILGLRAIAENGLVLKVDGRKRRATLRSPWRPFNWAQVVGG